MASGTEEALSCAGSVLSGNNYFSVIIRDELLFYFELINEESS